MAHYQHYNHYDRYSSHHNNNNDDNDGSGITLALTAACIGLILRTLAIRYLNSLAAARHQQNNINNDNVAVAENNNEQPQQINDGTAFMQQPQFVDAAAAAATPSAHSATDVATTPNDTNLSSSPSSSSPSQSSSSSSSSSPPLPPDVPAGTVVFRLLVSNTMTGGEAVGRWITLAAERSSYTVGRLIGEAFGAEIATGCRVTCLYQGLRLREEMNLDHYHNMTSGSTIHAIVQPPANTTPTNTSTTNTTPINNNNGDNDGGAGGGDAAANLNNNNGTPAATAVILNRSIAINAGMAMTLCVLTALAGTLTGILFVIHIRWHRPTMALAWLTSLIGAVIVFVATTLSGQRMIPVPHMQQIHRTHPLPPHLAAALAAAAAANGASAPFRLPSVQQQQQPQQAPQMSQ